MLTWLAVEWIDRFVFILLALVIAIKEFRLPQSLLYANSFIQMIEPGAETAL